VLEGPSVRNQKVIYQSLKGAQIEFLGKSQNSRKQKRGVGCQTAYEGTLDSFSEGRSLDLHKEEENGFEPRYFENGLVI